MLLLDLLYAAATPVAIPLLALKSLRTKKYRSGWPGRLGFGPDLHQLRKSNPLMRVLHLHCVSMGELNSVTTLIRQLLAAAPELHIALTTTTDTGTARAKVLYGEHLRVHPLRFPLDFSYAVEQFFDRVQPDLVALVELETWPNFLSIAQSRRIPVALINGRLSEKSFPRYKRIRPIMAAMLHKLTWIAVQTPAIAARFEALGAPRSRLDILPTLKYDNAPVPTSVATPQRDALAKDLGLTDEMQLFVGGSIGLGEEIPLLESYAKVKERHPEVRMAIVPRHPESVPEVVRSVKKAGFTPVLRSENRDLSQTRRWESQNISIIDTMGELQRLYSLAFAAFIGRSLVKMGGSDMIEAAALGVPIGFGPYTQNFAEVVELLTVNNAATIVYGENDLTKSLAGWLSDPTAAIAQGKLAQRLIENQRGSTARYVVRLLELLKTSRPSRLPI